MHVLQQHVSMSLEDLRRRNANTNPANETMKSHLVCLDLPQYLREYLGNCERWSQYVDHVRISYHLHATLVRREHWVDEGSFHSDHDHLFLAPLSKMDSLDALTDWWCRLRRQEHEEFDHIDSFESRWWQQKNYMRMKTVWRDYSFHSRAISRRSS